MLANVARKPLEHILCEFNPELEAQDEVSHGMHRSSRMNGYPLPIITMRHITSLK